MKNITIFCFLILTIIGCRKEEEIDYAKEISGDYSGKMSVYPVYFEKDSLNYDEKLTLTYVNSDSIHVSYSKSLTVNDSVKIDKLDFECTCGITLKYDKSVDFQGISRTEFILISSDNNQRTQFITSWVISLS